MARKRKLEKDHRIPLEYGLDILSGRWNSRVIGALADGSPKRYGVIRTQLEGVSDTALSLALQELEEANLLTRTVKEDAKRTAVEYQLTEEGKEAVPILRSICAWSAKYHPIIKDECLEKCKACPIFLSATSDEDGA